MQAEIANTLAVLENLKRKERDKKSFVIKMQVFRVRRIKIKKISRKAK